MELDKKEIRVNIVSEIEKTNSVIIALVDLTKPISPENAINNKSINDASFLKSREKLKNLQVALERLDTPDFEIYLRCKRPIPIGRIMLMPQTKKCVKCL
jgi:DnaK suppressor protein